MPEARFSTDAIDPEVGQEVYFTNTSKYADSYEWDFGDGVISTAENPMHIFTGTGVFEVTLTAINANMKDVAKMTIEIFIPTLLEVDVFEWNEELNFDNPIADASVFLYPNLTSWDNEQNIYAEGYTDADGVVVFSHLNEQRYYVDVYRSDYDNYTLAEEDIGWIETGIVLPHKINWFIAWVDYTGDKGELGTRRGGSYVIKKLQRKVVNPEKPAGTEGWETLYEKSIKVK
jgi:PKD repeat protein